MLESMHLGMVLNQIEDGSGNLVNHFKDWREIMLQHVNSCDAPASSLMDSNVSPN